MRSRPRSFSSAEMTQVQFVPDQIAQIIEAVEDLKRKTPPQSIHLSQRSILEIHDPDAAEAAVLLRNRVENCLPAEIVHRLGEQSGLGWNGFFGHVLAVWFGQGGRGFFQAMRQICLVHKIDLQFHWNRGREVEVKEIPRGAEPMIWGGLMGAALAFIALKIWRAYGLLGLLLVGLGLATGRILGKLYPKRFCGDPHCQFPLKRRQVTCPCCGATLVAPATQESQGLRP